MYFAVCTATVFLFFLTGAL